MRNHTPGPWRTGHHGEWVIAQDPEIGESVVAIVEGPSWKANAMLMASAPELLSALKNAANVLAAVATGQLPSIGTDSAALKLARAAIAKAEGVNDE
jgi:hypothetical protein